MVRSYVIPIRGVLTMAQTMSGARLMACKCPVLHPITPYELQPILLVDHKVMDPV